MVKCIRSGMILTAFIAAVTISTPTCTPLVHASLLPANITQVEQERTIRDRGSCLPHQYLDVSSLTCTNCTFCSAGTEHSSGGQCGDGHGERTTCTPCEKGSYQSSEGYSGLKCMSCETCHPGAQVIQNCTQTQNAICGDCPPGTYAFQKNVCLDCENDPTHEQCAQPTPTHPTLTNHSALILPSLESLPPTTPPPSTPPSSTPRPSTPPAETAPPSSLPSPTRNTSKDSGEQGTPAIKFSGAAFVVTVIVPAVVICVIILGCFQYKKWKARNGSSGRLPTKEPVAEFQNVLYGQVRVPTGDNSATANTATGNSAIASATTDNLATAIGPRRPLPTPGNETASNPEESVALLPEGEPRGPVCAQPESERLQRAGVPVNQPSASLLPSNISNNDYSLPRPLSSNGGPSGDGVHQENNVPRPPGAAKDIDAFEDHEAKDEDDDTLSLPGPLMS